MLIWFWVRQINIITNWIMMTQTCDIMFNWDFFLNSTNMWLRNNGNIRNYIVLNWRYIMYVNAILCWRLNEMTVANFGLMYISLLHWVPPVWVFISPTGWTQIRALISKMTMLPAMKTNIFHLITWERTPVWSLLGRIFHCGLFDWNQFIHIWSFQFQWVKGFMLNIKCVISKFTIVGIMWYIFRFSCDIAAINLRYGFLNLMAADRWWPQWLCTITRFTVVITGICSIDRWHRSLNFINIFMDYMLSSALYTSTVFFNNDTHVGIELIKVRIHLTLKFIKMRLLRKTLVFDGWTNTNQIVTFIGLRVRDMLPGGMTENWYGGNNVIPNVSVTIGMRMGIRIEIYNTRFRMINYPIFSIVNTVFYWYCISWNVTVNEVIMCRADGRRRLTMQCVTG